MISGHIYQPDPQMCSSKNIAFCIIAVDIFHRLNIKHFILVQLGPCCLAVAYLRTLLSSVGERGGVEVLFDIMPFEVDLRGLLSDNFRWNADPSSIHTHADRHTIDNISTITVTTRNLSSHIDIHNHAGSIRHSHVTSSFDLLTSESI